MNPQEPLPSSRTNNPEQASSLPPIPTAPIVTSRPPRNNRRRLLIIIGSVVLVLIISGTIFYLLANQGVQRSEATNTTPLPTSPTESISNSTEYEKGDNEVRFGHFELTINTIDKDYTISGDDIQPNLGNVLINLTVKNIDESVYSISDVDFVMQDDSGNLIPHSMIKFVEPAFVTATVKPGESVSGNLLYEVPENQSNLKLYYITQIYNEDAKKFENQEFLIPL